MHPLGEWRIRSVVEEIRSWDFFRFVEWRSTIDSTNRFLSQALKQNSLPIPALLAATRQTSGVGRGTNKWFSPDGCLMFSLAQSIPVDQSLLPLTVGMVIAKSIEPLVRMQPQIKWPNDIFIDGRKVGGILIEGIPSNTNDPKMMNVLIGVGLNCQVDFSTADADVQSKGTSLHQHAVSSAEEDYAPESVLVRIMRSWIEVQGIAQMDSVLQEEWGKYSLLDDRWVTLESAGHLYQGLCQGIDATGALLLKDAKGSVNRFLAGSVVSFQ